MRRLIHPSLCLTIAMLFAAPVFAQPPTSLKQAKTDIRDTNPETNSCKCIELYVEEIDVTMHSIAGVDVSSAVESANRVFVLYGLVCISQHVDSSSKREEPYFTIKIDPEIRGFFQTLKGS